MALAFALLLGPMMAAAGGAIDIGRALVLRQMLSARVDTIALSVANNPSTDPQTLQAAAASQVSATVLPAGTTLDPPTFSYDASARTLSLQVQATIKTFFLGLAGLPEIKFRSKAKVQQTAYVQLVLALDLTASMAPSIANVRSAAQSLVDEVFKASIAMRPSSVGLVSFGEYVNIGNVSAYKASTPFWLLIPPTGTFTQCANQCTPAPPGCTTVVDGVTVACPPSCVPVQPCVTATSDFYGCVSPREYNSTSKTAPWQTVSFGVYAERVQGNRKVCGSALLELTTNRTTVTSAINALKQSGTDTYLPAGLTWAWNMLAPAQPLSPTQVPAANPAGLPVTPAANTIAPSNVVVLLSDGGNTAIPWLDMYNTVAAPKAGSSYTFSVADTDTLTRTLCTNMKASGIQIFTVLYDTGLIGDKSAPATLMKDCASSPANFLYAASGSSLNDGFKRIAAMIRDVKLVE